MPENILVCICCKVSAGGDFGECGDSCNFFNTVMSLHYHCLTTDMTSSSGLLAC